MIWFSIFCSILLVSLTSGLPKSDEKPVCLRKGRLMNPKDCGSFYECMEDERAHKLVHFQRFCPRGVSFNSSSERCGKMLNVPGCSARSGRHFNSNPNYDHICKDSNVSFACADCQTQITCTDGHAYVTRCEGKLRCVANSPDFDGGICHTHFDDQCRCTSPNSYRRDPFSNSAFFFCNAENDNPTYYNCQLDMYFDEITKTCVYSDGSSACTTSGLFTFPENCAKYYMCTYAIEGWVKNKMICPDKQLFNQETGTCEDPCNWERQEFKCETQGRFQNPSDCQRFTECIDDSNGGLLAMERHCPPGFHFNEKNKKCVARILSSCKQHNEGPLKQCKKDFLAICKSERDIIPEIIPETVPIEENDSKEPESDLKTEEKPIDTTLEVEKMSEQKLDKGTSVGNNPVTIKPTEKISVEETSMGEKLDSENQTEGNPVKDKLDEEQPFEVIPEVMANFTQVEGKPENKPELTDVPQI